MRIIRDYIKYFFATLMCFSFVIAKAQDIGSARDTIKAARVVSERPTVRDAGTKIVAIPELRSTVSVTGDADVIKFIQTLPGVSMGAEGGSAIYVRGGNIGSNITTLDGVPIYGSSHLLGLATVYPSDIISDASFRVGGFRGDEGNVTSSHIGLKTADGSYTKSSFSASASTFILGGTASVPIVREKVSLLASARVSPLGPEFKAVQSLVGGALDSLSRTRAMTYDAFAKVKWIVDSDNMLSLSVFGSQDGYSYRYANSDEGLRWANCIINARHDGVLANGWKIKDGLSYDHFSNSQWISRDMNGTINNLDIVSSLDELMADAVFTHPIQSYAEIRLGARERFTWFNPGTSASFKGKNSVSPSNSSSTDHTSHSSITTLHGEWNLSRKRLELMTSGRLNMFIADEPGVSKCSWRFNPELSLLARVNIARWLAIEATADWTVQYHHTLEGIPIGWSADLIVPTDPRRPPERSRQIYAGLFTSFGKHHITIGAYDKAMKGLVYFSDASLLFSQAISGWNQNIKVGTGSSRGVEFLYEKDGERLTWRIAYTLSKTDRTFAEINSGNTFPAKFDRRHILNATASLTVADRPKFKTKLTGLFTFQSGHRETVASAEYPTVSLFGKAPAMDYYSSVNNYKMPDYMRLDLGCSFSFKTKRPQELTVGVYNVMNRHNPFSIIYDDRSRSWKQVSLIPVMPSFNYSIKF